MVRRCGGCRISSHQHHRDMVKRPSGRICKGCVNLIEKSAPSLAKAHSLTKGALLERSHKDHCADAGSSHSAALVVRRTLPSQSRFIPSHYLPRHQARSLGYFRLVRTRATRARRLLCDSFADCGPIIPFRGSSALAGRHLKTCAFRFVILNRQGSGKIIARKPPDLLITNCTSGYARYVKEP